ncbi:MAG: hypothetical protein ACD_47C00617G0001 [uncultured bacterium]|nr:MAG: hypothetical protein ACD_47C00617G0001 [uncultured bacterium]
MSFKCISDAASLSFTFRPNSDSSMTKSSRRVSESTPRSSSRLSEGYISVLPVRFLSRSSRRSAMGALMSSFSSAVSSGFLTASSPARSNSPRFLISLRLSLPRRVRGSSSDIILKSVMRIYVGTLSDSSSKSHLI